MYKQCKRCNTDYPSKNDFIKRTEYIGIQKLNGIRYNLELRNCMCGTTLAHRVSSWYVKLHELRSNTPKLKEAL